MATRTKLRTISAIDDVRAVLDNSNPARLMSIGSTWSKIRVALRMSIDAGAAITGTPRFAVGVCSGTTNRWDNGAGVTTHFVGCVTNSATWNYSSPIVFGNDFNVCTRVGTSLTVGLSPGAIGFNNLTADKRQLLFVDITKGAPDFTLNVFGVNPAFGSDVSKATFMEIAAIESATLTDYLWGTARDIAVDEGGDGTLNAVNVAWDRTVQKIEISDIAVVRFA